MQELERKSFSYFKIKTYIYHLYNTQHFYRLVSITLQNWNSNVVGGLLHHLVLHFEL